jgi:hypothetical protein
MTRRALRAGLISEQSIKKSLTENKGDIFLTSCALDCTAREIDQYIRQSAELQSFAAAIEQIKVDPAYARMSAEQFENELADLSRSYRIDGLEEIHKLATMDFGDSAALAKVKLDAAVSLRGNGGHHTTNTDGDAEMAELNKLYHAHAPRIKEIRQTVITLRDDLEVSPVTIVQMPDR